MNWLAMGRKLVVGADGPRNQSLTLLLLVVALAPLPARAFDGSLSLELSGGNKTFSGSLIGDWGVLPDRLYVVASYGIVRQTPPDASTSYAPSHLFGLGLDWIPSEHVLTSLNASFSPKATDSDVIRDTPPRIDVSSTRRNAQLQLSGGYQSAGLGNLEWAADVSAVGAWYELQSHGRFGLQMYDETTNLFLLKPSAGVTLTLFDRTDVGVRGSCSIYSSDPSEAGGLPDTAGSSFKRVLLQEAAQALVLRADATAAYSSAPVWWDAKATVVHRFGDRVTGRLSYTFVRYVHDLGNQHVLATKWAFKVTGWLKLWAAVTLQYDALNTEPSFWSGYGTLGGEVATE